MLIFVKSMHFMNCNGFFNYYLELQNLTILYKNYTFLMKGAQHIFCRKGRQSKHSIYKVADNFSEKSATCPTCIAHIPMIISSSLSLLTSVSLRKYKMISLKWLQTHKQVVKS